MGWGRRVVACMCLAIGVSSLGGVAVAARPSQTTPTPAGDWVHSVCGALVSWRGDIENAATEPVPRRSSDLDGGFPWERELRAQRGNGATRIGNHDKSIAGHGEECRAASQE